MEKYGKETESNQAIDFLQAQVGCCGVTGWADWQQTQWGKGHTNRLPHSCCESTATGVCRPQAPDARLYKAGCHSLILDVTELHSLHIAAVLLLATLVHGVAVLLACCLAKSKGPYQHLS
eukprot:TRINITY_DN32409_c0_g1_i1.p2 TRINITY_DN32409_c0_g1~~TRINITY_DN32409_c0_g1_i1.p2  ORF type:complete len:120 (-),score=27.35 TRINITY_DN32409_c0_g1_i1:630-989(-)